MRSDPTYDADHLLRSEMDAADEEMAAAEAARIREPAIQAVAREVLRGLCANPQESWRPELLVDAAFALAAQFVLRCEERLEHVKQAVGEVR